MSWSAGDILTVSFVFCITYLLYKVVFTCSRWYNIRRKVAPIPGNKEVIPIVDDFIFLKSLKEQGKYVNFHLLINSTLTGQYILCKKEKIHRSYLGHHVVITLLGAETVQPILSATKNLDKAFSYNMVHPWLGSGLLLSPGSEWHAQRKRLNPAFHYSLLEEFLSIMNKEAGVLNQILSEESSYGTVDISKLVAHCSLDILCESSLGVSINAQRNPKNEYVRAVNDVCSSFIDRSLDPLMQNNAVFFNTPSGRKIMKKIQYMQDFARQVISQRKQEIINSKTKSERDVNGEQKRKKYTLIDLLLKEHIESGTVSEEEIRRQVDTFMFAGHDTTAVAMCWILYLIGLHAEVQEKVYEELQSIFGDDLSRPATSEDLRNMKYFECTIKESMRLYPSVPMIGRYVSESFKVGAYEIPAGTTIHIPIAFIHKDEDHFPKPEEFHPERFFPENSQNRHQYSFIPFSMGPRNCIGQKMAMMEIKTVVSTVLRKFKLKSLEHRDKVGPVHEIVLRPLNGLLIQFEQRLS